MFALQSLGQTGQSQCCYSAVDNTEKQFRGQKEKKKYKQKKEWKKKGTRFAGVQGEGHVWESVTGWKEILKSLLKESKLRSRLENTKEKKSSDFILNDRRWHSNLELLSLFGYQKNSVLGDDEMELLCFELCW